MLQPEKFICISYSSVDFLIPNDDVASAVGLKESNTEFMLGEGTGIYDFDALAADFEQTKRETNTNTMVMLKDKGEGTLSFVTAQECKVCIIPLQEFNLFSDFYTERLKKYGILACSFVENKARFLIDVKTAIEYKNGITATLEEL